MEPGLWSTIAKVCPVGRYHFPWGWHHLRQALLKNCPLKFAWTCTEYIYVSSTREFSQKRHTQLPLGVCRCASCVAPVCSWHMDWRCLWSRRQRCVQKWTMPDLYSSTNGVVAKWSKTITYVAAILFLFFCFLLALHFPCLFVLLVCGFVHHVHITYIT